MNEFIQCDEYFISVESFRVPENCPHRFIAVGTNFRQQIQCRTKVPELVVTCWVRKTQEAISQREMQMHVQWINDSINLLKELCQK